MVVFRASGWEVAAHAISSEARMTSSRLQFADVQDCGSQRCQRLVDGIWGI